MDSASTIIQAQRPIKAVPPKKARVFVKMKRQRIMIFFSLSKMERAQSILYFTQFGKVFKMVIKLRIE